ncbi:DUF4199 domain-containing protein [Algoriphagus aquimarinus]|nr:DUF4199 domain-containing protein [Algoriphagus aquimarinus]
MNKTSFFKSTLKQGIIMGLAFCLYTTLMWLTKLDTTYLSIGQYVDMAIILLPIVMIFWAIKQETNSYQVSIIQRIGIAIFVSAISYLIYNPFLYTYHHFINPDWFGAVLNLKEVELTAVNVPQEEITATLENMKTSSVAQADLFRLSSLIPSVVVIPTLVALLSLIFIKNKVKG